MTKHMAFKEVYQGSGGDRRLPQPPLMTDGAGMRASFARLCFGKRASDAVEFHHRALSEPDVRIVPRPPASRLVPLAAAVAIAGVGLCAGCRGRVSCHRTAGGRC